MADTRKVFISYAWRDGATVARWLFERFNAAPGWSAWMDTNLHADTVFAHELQKRLDDADLVVVVVSPDVNRRETPSFVQKELLYATDPDVNKPVYAARAHNCQLPLIIQGYTYTDFFPETIYEAAFAKLVAQIDKGVPPPARSRRERELEYLRDVARQHSFWGKVFVDTPAEARIAPQPDEASVSDLDIGAFLTDMAAAVYGDQGHSRDDDARATVETFGALSDALAQFERVAIVGDPGGGKTTTLKRFAYRLADDAAHDETQPLPVFVPLGGFEGGALDTYIEAQFGGLHVRDYLPDRLVVLLDGLNETAFENVQQVAAWLERNPRARVMLTCRKLDYVERKLALQRVDVLPLDMERMLAFMAAYSLSESARETLFWGLAGEKWIYLWGCWQKANLTFRDFWHGAELTSEHPAYGNTTPELDRLYNAMRAALREHDTYPGLLGLVRNPFLLTMTIAIFAREKVVPANRAGLFDGFVRQMWDKRGKPAAAKRPPWIDETVQRHALMKLAYQMQHERHGTLVDTAWAREVIADAAPGHDADHLIYLLASAGILDLSSTTIKFTHQLLQEYFAAFEMGEDLKRGVPATKYFPGEHWWEATGWEETAILLAGMTGDSSAVVAWLTPVQPTLAYRCATESGAACADSVLQRLYEPPTGARIDPIVRSVGGRLLAERGDPRPGVGVRADGLPDIEWVEIPAGKFLMGSDPAQDPQARENELPQHEVALPAYKIARYPVTNAQFAAFVNAPAGYNHPDWWTPAGLEWKSDRTAPDEHVHPDFRLPNHPRIYVCWYEAVAFCRWLSVQLGMDVRLPTEAEWEKAARGTDGRIYPYGDTFDALKGNTGASGIGMTSAVGILPDGASPYSVLDMSGNVSEWCVTKWRESYADPAADDLNGTDGRVLRGGSWNYIPQGTRAASRGRNDPNVRSYSVGFRLVVGAAPI